MNEEQLQGNPSEDSVPGEADVTSSEGQENAAAESSASLTDILKEATGREFSSMDDAVKSLKETYTYVGKAGQIEKELEAAKAKLQAGDGDANALAKEVAELKRARVEDQFYASNPDYKAYAEVIRKWGDDPQEVVKDEAFQAFFEKAKAGEQAQSARSVLQSNPRLGAIRDKSLKAREAMEAGNIREAQQIAVDAVIDTFVDDVK